MNLLIALLLQASVAASPPPVADPEAHADPSAVSGVVVPSPKAKDPPKVYAPTYRAAPTLASPAPQISGSTNVDNLFVDARFRSNTVSTVMVSQLAAQRHRAKKAADLINAGHCPEALQSVFNAGDRQLIIRVAEVCGLPSPMEHAKGPPF